jgi:hypothetical protein
VPAFGYDYVPGNLAGALALTREASGHAASRSATSSPDPGTVTSCATASTQARSGPPITRRGAGGAVELSGSRPATRVAGWRRSG